MLYDSCIANTSLCNIPFLFLYFLCHPYILHLHYFYRKFLIFLLYILVICVCAFFDVRVFHPNAQSYRSSKIETLYRRHENLKKREYGDRIREVENGSFTPLVFATPGGWSRETTIFYKRLAEFMSISRNAKYRETISWMRRKLSFSLVKSAIMCIRGSRSIKANYNDNITLGLTESHPV